MSAIIHVMGRVTKDPAMQQGKNNGSEYISLDLASSQRSQNTQNGQNGYESMFYQCYFNKFLAERLIKAGVKSGTCIYVYGDLEIHPFLYQQGQKAGQPGVGAKINVKDWQFCLSNKPENENNGNTGKHQNGNSIGVIFNSILMYLYFAHSVFVDLKILLSGLVIHLLFLLLWIFIITKSLVISAGKKYARALLSACDSGNID